MDMLCIPGYLTPPARSIRAAYFLTNSYNKLSSVDDLLQGFRLLPQFDILKGAVVHTSAGHTHETLYTIMYHTSKLSFHIKNHNNINLQNYSLHIFKKERNINFIELNKTMTL